MAKKSITKRWAVNNLGVIVLALLVIEMAIIYALQSYYYNSAKQYLFSKLNAVTSVLSIHSQDSAANFSAEMRNMLETFNEKDKIELMAINSKGRVVLTSSGFSPDAGGISDPRILHEQQEHRPRPCIHPEPNLGRELLR